MLATPENRDIPFILSLFTYETYGMKWTTHPNSAELLLAPEFRLFNLGSSRKSGGFSCHRFGLDVPP
jgi:hypothetical protein